MKKRLNIQGKTFNFLKVVSRDEFAPKTSGVVWICECICGKQKKTTATSLINNIARSCGCMKFKEGKIHKNKKYSETEASFRAKISNYKSHANKRKIPWELSMEDGLKLLKSNCIYCNSKPSNIYNVAARNRGKNYKNLDSIKNYEIKYNGIDRQNNDLGYTYENSVSCCTNCNTAKLNMKLEDFKNWIEKLIKHFPEWK